MSSNHDIDTIILQITTSVHTETGVIAWISAGLLCVFGCWLGCWLIPLCMDSLEVKL